MAREKKILNALFMLLIVIIVNVKSQSFYKAAVVEFSPRITAYSPQDLLLENAAFYVSYVEQAAEKNVQIIVFPEDGLTGLNIWNNGATIESITNYSTLVPDPKDEIAPCDDITLGYYTKALVDISCSARTNSIYIVINVLEKSHSSNGNKSVIYNSDVVFDRNGVVVAKYRKINLFYEPFLTPGNTTVTFRTDFGVTFAIFTCFDILFKNPSLDALSDDVTDVIYPVAWFSEVPFLAALSVQAGYAKANGINLLASGLSDAANGNGGSGIYLANGSISETYISAISTSKMIIQDVPIWSKRQSSCDKNTIVSSSNVPVAELYSSTGGLSLFKIIVEDLSNYTSENVNLTRNYSSNTICSEGSSFCCTFDVAVDLQSTTNTNLVYKFVVFNGIRKLGNSSSGNQICGVVACLSDDILSCGERKHLEPMIGVRFNSINITGSFLETPAGFSLPSTLTFSLLPIQDYLYCRKSVNNRAEIYMNLTVPQDSIYAFGIFGRNFERDGRSVGRSIATFSTICTASVFFLTVLTVLQQKIIS